MGTPDSPYIASIRTYRRALESALAIASDPFKAPEEVVETSRPVVNAAWEMEVQFAALKNKPQ
jgi:hypothetical protein